jgi:hypothetical protein
MARSSERNRLWVSTGLASRLADRGKALITTGTSVAEVDPRAGADERQDAASLRSSSVGPTLA